MAKAKTKTVTVDILTLDYQLSELPSSQHRAGLAGLVLVVQWLERQPDFKQKVEEGAVCRFTRLDDRGATLELNQTGLELLFNDIYAASTEEQSRPQLLKNQRTKEVIQPLREEEREETDKSGKTKTKKVYIYPVVVPKGSFLSDNGYDKSSDGKNGHWVKLWRDMVWNILRGVPATRKPFEMRAKGTYTEDAVAVWKQLLQPNAVVDLPSTYFLGAQANNAENVPFKDQARFQFLLHFWLFAAQIYVPAIVDNEGKREFIGYALAVPDVASLEWFCEEIPSLLSDRSIEISGYRPRDCIVDLAVESALDVMKRLRDRMKQGSGEQTTRQAVLGVDVIHTEKQGNNVRVLSVTRLDPEEAMIDEYTQIRQSFWSPLFRRQCLLNLVNKQPWYVGFDALLCSLPYEQSIENDYFRRDVREKLEALINEGKNMDEATASSAAIEPLVFQLVRNYVSRKLKAKYDLEWKVDWKGLKQDELSKRQDYKDYSDKKAKLAKTAFLDIRSRTEQMDFVNYFVSSLCSVPQYMNAENFAELSKALYQDTDKIRTLTLLALSANS